MNIDNNSRETIERFKTAQEFAQDYVAYCNCRNMLQNYVRFNAMVLLKSLIEKYELEINQFGFLIDGVHVIRGVNYDDLTDWQIKDQLIYVGQRIPVYAFIREGNKQIAKTLLNQIGFSGFIF